MEPIGCPETSLIDYQSTLRNISEERWSHLHGGGNLRWSLSGKFQDTGIGYILVLPWLALFRSKLSTGQHNTSLILVLTGNSRWRQEVWLQSFYRVPVSSDCPTLISRYTRVNKNPSAWNFLGPKPEVTCGTVAIIIRVVLLYPYLRIRAVSLSSIHYNQSHRIYINRRRQYICLIWN